MNTVHSTTESKYTAAFFAKGDILFVPALHILCREPGRSSSQELVGPEANTGVEKLSHCMCMKVQAYIHIPPSCEMSVQLYTTLHYKQQAKVVCNIVEDHKVI